MEIDLFEFSEYLRKTDDALATTIKVDWRTALQIVIQDLIAKYRHNVERGNQEWIEAFEKVLSYYLAPEEIEEVKNNTQEYT